jgi:DNA-binding transcriptional LysR family regulator
VFDWSDIRIFLAVAREGSTLKAGRSLGLNQTTVSRRIQALEHALGLSLFARGTRGYALTAQGSALLDCARGLEGAAGEVERRAARLARVTSDCIRVSAAPLVMNYWVAPLVAAFRDVEPEVTVDLDASEATVSLETGEADVAFRPADAITGDTLVARRLGSIPWGLYCAEPYAERKGVPRSIEDLTGHDVVFYTPAFAERIALLRWLRDRLPPRSIVSTLNSVTVMAGALRSGSGIGPVPLIDGDMTPGLRLCFAPPELLHPLWLVAGPEAYRQPQVRALMRLAGERIPRGPWLLR